MEKLNTRIFNLQDITYDLDTCHENIFIVGTNKERRLINDILISKIKCVKEQIMYPEDSL